MNETICMYGCVSTHIYDDSYMYFIEFKSFVVSKTCSIELYLDPSSYYHNHTSRIFVCI